MKFEAGKRYKTKEGFGAFRKDLNFSSSLDDVEFFTLEVSPTSVLADIDFIPYPVCIPNSFIRSKFLEED